MLKHGKTKDIKMTPLPPTPQPPLTMSSWHPTWMLTRPRPHVLTLVKVSKNTQMNFPYHTESTSQHVHHFKPIEFFWKKINYFPRRGGGVTPSRKIL